MPVETVNMTFRVDVKENGQLIGTLPNDNVQCYIGRNYDFDYVVSFNADCTLNDITIYGENNSIVQQYQNINQALSANEEFTVTFNRTISGEGTHNERIECNITY